MRGRPGLGASGGVDDNGSSFDDRGVFGTSSLMVCTRVAGTSVIPKSRGASMSMLRQDVMLMLKDALCNRDDWNDDYVRLLTICFL